LLSGFALTRILNNVKTPLFIYYLKLQPILAFGTYQSTPRKGMNYFVDILL